MLEIILIIYGVYALISGKFRISRHYGLKGKGARWAGVMIFFILYYSWLIQQSLVSIIDLRKHWIFTLFIISAPIVLIVISIVILIKIFGNAYAKTYVSSKIQDSVGQSKVRLLGLWKMFLGIIGIAVHLSLVSMVTSRYLLLTAAVFTMIIGIFTLSGLLEIITGVPFNRLSEKWHALKGWQRGLLGTLFVIFAIVIIMIVIFNIFG